ncbi:MAG: M23 family metallopeptidase [Clostridia bacterium]|nr:M23 family metallopeptidase [Clostridia bacterium]
MIFILKSFNSFFIILSFLVFFICIFFTPTLFESKNLSANISNEILAINPNGFVWPTPGYTRINSFFGKRFAPTKGASTFHKGIDIGAPEGTSFIAVADGEITFANFLGGGGYTLTLTVREFKNILLSL